METGVNARAIDFAKFGVLFLNEGKWQGNQVISKAWVKEATQPLLPDNYADYYPERFDLLPGQGGVLQLYVVGHDAWSRRLRLYTTRQISKQTIKEGNSPRFKVGIG